MNQEKISQFKQRLLEERTSLRQVEESLEAWAIRNNMNEIAGELSGYDQHPSDVGSQMFEREKNIGLLENIESQLDKVEHALKAIEWRTYGQCENCGKEISEERLQTLPYVSLCVDCQRDAEELESPDVSGRSVEKDVLNPPLARSLKEHSDYSEFNSEDSWQAVARFGTANSPQDIPGVDDYDDAYLDANEELGVVTPFEVIAVRDRTWTKKNS